MFGRGLLSFPYLCESGDHEPPIPRQFRLRGKLPKVRPASRVHHKRDAPPLRVRLRDHMAGGEMIKPTIPSIRQQLFNATPMEVWREYVANGYTWVKAIDEELSYAETDGCICGAEAK